MNREGGLIMFKRKVLGLVVVSAFGICSSCLVQGKTAFPDGFRWCVASAAFQVEGGNTTSDWSLWEKEKGRIKGGRLSGLACDEWNRLPEDIVLMRELHVGEYRMSIEWAKVEPLEGQYDQEVIAHYHDAIRSLLDAGIRPMITLQHFTFPAWLSAKGAWEWSGSTDAFAKFTSLVYTSIAPDVEDWVTINEPAVNIINGYLYGTMPPGEKRDFGGLTKVFTGMLRGHAAAYHQLHDLAAKSGHTVRVGLAHHLRTMDPYQKWNPLDQVAARVVDQAWNWSIPDAVESGIYKLKIPFFVNVTEEIAGLKGTEDYFGLNYYTGDLMHFSTSGAFETHTRDELAKNDLGWDIYPQGFARILKSVHARYPRLSIFITENGTADAVDRFRPQFIRDHLLVLSQAIQDGIDIRGYCHWSLMDNFEWNEGYTARFGLYEMDPVTRVRTPRESSRVFSSIAKENAL